jgi:hypothetical protein
MAKNLEELGVLCGKYLADGGYKRTRSPRGVGVCRVWQGGRDSQWWMRGTANADRDLLQSRGQIGRRILSSEQMRTTHHAPSHVNRVDMTEASARCACTVATIAPVKTLRTAVSRVCPSYATATRSGRTCRRPVGHKLLMCRLVVTPRTASNGISSASASFSFVPCSSIAL